MIVQDLGTMRYKDAWALQEKIHDEVLNGAEERLLLVEHTPVITLGRRGELEGAKHLIASQKALNQLGVELVQSDRGGDITFHGPGQIVAYPIVRLNAHRLSVGGYVRKLEETVIAALGRLDVQAKRVDGCVGIWVGGKDEKGAACDTALSKICAIGVRIRRGVSLHGIALNVETDLRYFDLIVPCGLTGKGVTSLHRILNDQTPSIQRVKALLIDEFLSAFKMDRM